jgi:hypothetical protein
MTFSTNCLTCGGTGTRIVHQQGDPVPGYPCNQYTRTVFASTLYVPCECMIIRSEVIEATPFPVETPEEL